MAEERIWRKTVDAVDAAVGPRLNELTHSREFGDSLGRAGGAVDFVRRRVERRSRQLLHLFNLPAGSDMLRLQRQIAALDHEVRTLRRELARHESADPPEQPAATAAPVKKAPVKKAAPAKKAPVKKAAPAKKAAFARKSTGDRDGA